MTQGKSRWVVDNWDDYCRYLNAKGEVSLVSRSGICLPLELGRPLNDPYSEQVRETVSGFFGLAPEDVDVATDNYS